LNPKTALIVIDLQKSIASIPSVHPMTDVVKNASKLTSAFRRHGLLVVLVSVTGGASGRIEQMQRVHRTGRSCCRSSADSRRTIL
jgi:nicotinamidase-related amidase